MIWPDGCIIVNKAAIPVIVQLTNIFEEKNSGIERRIFYPNKTRPIGGIYGKNLTRE
jgi:hypothetical protein